MDGCRFNYIHTYFRGALTVRKDPAGRLVISSLSFSLCPRYTSPKVGQSASFLTQPGILYHELQHPTLRDLETPSQPSENSNPHCHNKDYEYRHCPPHGFIAPRSIGQVACCPEGGCSASMTATSWQECRHTGRLYFELWTGEGFFFFKSSFCWEKKPNKNNLSVLSLPCCCVSDQTDVEVRARERSGNTMYFVSFPMDQKGVASDRARDHFPAADDECRVRSQSGHACTVRQVRFRVEHGLLMTGDQVCDSPLLMDRDRGSLRTVRDKE
ncbi:hypothetical protein VTO42DRAFT_5473 [Malbranchea cinnamomea]